MPLRPPKDFSIEQIVAAERFARLTGIATEDDPLFRLDEVCHGKANGCRCKYCVELQRQIDEHGFTPEGAIAPPPEPPQPWHPSP